MLPKNPTVDDYKKYHDDLLPEQQKQFRKAGLLNMINLIYTDKADDVMEDETPAKGTITSGKFSDKRGNQTLYFSFRLTKSGRKYMLDYKPDTRGLADAN